MSEEAWEFLFMMVVLKLPIVYLVGVVWWAIRARPDPYAAVAVVETPAPDAPCSWTSRSRHPRTRPPRPRPTVAGARR